MSRERTGPSAAATAQSTGETVCTCFRLRRATRNVSRIYDRHLSLAGLRATQFTLLAAIDELTPRPLGPLADTLGMDRTTLTRNLDPLEREGLVRLDAGGDRRERVAVLTPAGRTRLAAARPHWQAAQGELERTLGTETVDALNDLLDMSVRRLRS